MRGTRAPSNRNYKVLIQQRLISKIGGLPLYRCFNVTASPRKNAKNPTGCEPYPLLTTPGATCERARIKTALLITSFFSVPYTYHRVMNHSCYTRSKYEARGACLPKEKRYQFIGNISTCLHFQEDKSPWKIRQFIFRYSRWGDSRHPRVTDTGRPRRNIGVLLLLLCYLRLSLFPFSADPHS